MAYQNIGYFYFLMLQYHATLYKNLVLLKEISVIVLKCHVNTVLWYHVIFMHFGSCHFKLINEQTMILNFKKGTHFLHLLPFVKLIKPRDLSYAASQSAATLQSIRRPSSHRSFNKSPWLRFFFWCIHSPPTTLFTSVKLLNIYIHI